MQGPGQRALGQVERTVFPALSRPRIRMQYSSFWNTYLYSPDSSVYILPGRRELSSGGGTPSLPTPAPGDLTPARRPAAPQCLQHRLQLPTELRAPPTTSLPLGAARDSLLLPDGGPHAFTQTRSRPSGGAGLTAGSRYAGDIPELPAFRRPVWCSGRSTAGGPGAPAPTRPNTCVRPGAQPRLTCALRGRSRRAPDR